MRNRLLKYFNICLSCFKFKVFNVLAIWGIGIWHYIHTQIHPTQTYIYIYICNTHFCWSEIDISLCVRYLYIYDFCLYRWRNEDYVSGDAGWTIYLGQGMAFVSPFAVAYRANTKLHMHVAPIQDCTSTTYRYLRFHTHRKDSNFTFTRWQEIRCKQS